MKVPGKIERRNSYAYLIGSGPPQLHDEATRFKREELCEMKKDARKVLRQMGAVYSIDEDGLVSTTSKKLR